MKWLRPTERAKLEKWLDSGFTPSGKHGPLQRLFLAIALETPLRQTEITGGDLYGKGEPTEFDDDGQPTKWKKVVRGRHDGLHHGQANLVDKIWEAVVLLKRKDGVRVNFAMGPRTWAILQDLFPDLVDEYTPIFPDGPTPNACYKFCRRLGDSLGIPDLTPHTLRHTAGRDLREAGYGPHIIQAALGHKVGTTSLIYYESTNEEAIDAMRKIRGGG